MVGHDRVEAEQALLRVPIVHDPVRLRHAVTRHSSKIACPLKCWGSSSHMSVVSEV